MLADTIAQVLYTIAALAALNALRLSLAKAPATVRFAKAAISAPKATRRIVVTFAN